MTKDEVLEDAWVLIVTSRQAYGNREPMPKWEAAKLKWLKDYGQVKDAVEPPAGHDCPAVGMDVSVRGVCPVCDALLAREPRAPHLEQYGICPICKAGTHYDGRRIHLDGCPAAQVKQGAL